MKSSQRIKARRLKHQAHNSYTLLDRLAAIVPYHSVQTLNHAKAVVNDFAKMHGLPYYHKLEEIK